MPRTALGDPLQPPSVPMPVALHGVLGRAAGAEGWVNSRYREHPRDPKLLGVGRGEASVQEKNGLGERQGKHCIIIYRQGVGVSSQQLPRDTQTPLTFSPPCSSESEEQQQLFKVENTARKIK